MRPHPPVFKNPVCKGSIVLGNACGHCERCIWEMTKFNPPNVASGGSKPRDRIKVELAAVTRERDALKDALQRLVDAKAEKDKNGDTARYRRLKIGAWESARDTLARLGSDDLRKPTA